MTIHPLFIDGFTAGRTWRADPAARRYESLPFYRQTSSDAQRFNRAFAAGLQADPAVTAEQAFDALLQQRADLTDLYNEAAAH